MKEDWYEGEHFANVPEEGIMGWNGRYRRDGKKYSYGEYEDDGVNVYKFDDEAIVVEYIPTGKTLFFPPEDSEVGWDWAKSRAKHVDRISWHFR